MGDDTGIANRLRAAGLRVSEIAGWQTAGSSDFNPRGSVNHHTAGSANGATPSLSTCIYGRSDLPGPLCNVYQSREADGRDIFYVIAAGRANHAGEGGWKGLSGNSSVYGLEIEHTGTSALPQGRIDLAARCHAAMFTGDPGYVCQHKEWTTRKIDAATNVDGNDFRNRVANAEQGDWLDMASIEDVKNAVRSVLNEGTAQGQSSWAGTSKATLSGVQGNSNKLNVIKRPTFNLYRDKRDNKLWRIPLDSSCRTHIPNTTVKNEDINLHKLQGGTGDEIAADTAAEQEWLDSIPILEAPPASRQGDEVGR